MVVRVRVCQFELDLGLGLELPLGYLCNKYNNHVRASILGDWVIGSQSKGAYMYVELVSLWNAYSRACPRLGVLAAPINCFVPT